jgi:hypothetical protein
LVCVAVSCDFQQNSKADIQNQEPGGHCVKWNTSRTER